MDSVAKVRSRYESASRFYDHIERLPIISSLEKRYRLEAVKMLRARAGETLVEIGCGTGVMLAIASRLYPGTRLVGVDISPRMLEILQNKVLGCRAVLADAADLPIEDGFADHVLVAYALTIISDPEGAVKEIYRILKPGGTVAVLDSCRPTSLPLNLVFPMANLISSTVGYTRMDRDIEKLLMRYFEQIGYHSYCGGFVFSSLMGKSP